MSEFLTIGEPIALFASQDTDQSLKDALNFRKYLAGAEVNVAVGVSRLGHSAQYITRLGEDPFGDFIKDQLRENHVQTDYIDSTPDYWTAFQLKNKVSTGDPDIFYFRRGSAAAHFDAKTLDRIDFSEVKFAHLSGIFPAISEQALAAFRHLIDLLHEHNIRTTFDPNLRPQLWSSPQKMAATLNELAKEAEIILPGDNEGELLVGSRDPETIADFYLNQSARTQTVVVKVGPKGAYVKNKGEAGYWVKGFKVAQVVDTVGAGDGFALGLITALMEGKSQRDAVVRANAIGAFAVQAPGDNDGYPTPEQLQAFLDKNLAVMGDDFE
ncbi:MULTISPECIES: sugar kinase [Lacticaseibacillus]|uniref:sugar kinase n=1 Tax=Lacticaseibacillus TaxID=2759736 RepID=UPI00063DBFDB|nr:MULTISPECIES: sugar kinase [Lacticaseibacillus]KLI75552.1 2-dehydro-3-deoxygluconokinase [Lacticaseibacillus casei]